jgi:hypothetical protein
MELAKEFKFIMGLTSTDKTVYTAKLAGKEHKVIWGTQQKYEKIIPAMYNIIWKDEENNKMKEIKYDLEDVIDCIKKESWVIVENVIEEPEQDDNRMKAFRERESIYVEVFIKDDRHKTFKEVFDHYRSKGFNLVQIKRLHFGIDQLEKFKEEYPDYKFVLFNNTKSIWASFYKPNSFEVKVGSFIKFKPQLTKHEL